MKGVTVNRKILITFIVITAIEIKAMEQQLATVDQQQKQLIPLSSGYTDFTEEQTTLSVPAKQNFNSITPSGSNQFQQPLINHSGYTDFMGKEQPAPNQKTKLSGSGTTLQHRSSQEIFQKNPSALNTIEMGMSNIMATSIYSSSPAQFKSVSTEMTGIINSTELASVADISLGTHQYDTNNRDTIKNLMCSWAISLKTGRQQCGNNKLDLNDLIDPILKQHNGYAYYTPGFIDFLITSAESKEEKDRLTKEQIKKITGIQVIRQSIYEEYKPEMIKYMKDKIQTERATGGGSTTENDLGVTKNRWFLPKTFTGIGIIFFSGACIGTGFGAWIKQPVADFLTKLSVAFASSPSAQNIVTQATTKQ